MKTILVVGGTKGIGEAVVKLLDDNNKVIVFSRGETLLHPNVTHYKLDVLEDELPEISELSGLVYCPGSINLKPINRLKLSDFRDDYEINVIGAVRVIQHYIKVLQANQSSVVLFSTVATQMGMPFHASVAAVKSAVEGLTKSLAAEYATKVRFNCVAPTVTDTTLATKLLRSEKQQENIRERHPLKKYLSPTDVANMVVFLLSEKASSISGQIIPIDAGIVTLKV